MFRTVSRKLLWAYALGMLVAALGFAHYDFYAMDGDGTAFMDIAQDLRTGHAALAINGYWNPGYPAVLAAAESLVHPSLWHELIVVRYANVAVFSFAMLCTLFFTTGLARARSSMPGGRIAVVTNDTLHLLGLGLLTLSLQRELSVAAPRSDTLLLCFLLLAMGLLLRLYTGARLWRFAALGIVLGCGYLTKSFAFLPSLALLGAMLMYAVTRKDGQHRLHRVGGVLLAGICFLLTAGPYIAAISHQLGHLTTGDSARLNYAFFIDNTGRWHEWYHHDLGLATGRFLHPEQVIAGPPPVFSFAAHPFGTFPLWFDPAWWTAGLKPKVSLPGHALRLARNIVVFLRYLLNRPEPLVLLAVVVLFGGAAWHGLRQRALLWMWAPLLWGLLMLGIYFPIDLQDRYLSAPFLLVLLPLFAALTARERNTSTAIATGLVALFAVTTLAQAGTYLAERRRHILPAWQAHPGLDAEIFPAAEALDRLGLQPFDRIACMGDIACYTDHYWARLAGAQILAEVQTADEKDPQTLWDSIPDTRRITDPLQAMGLRFLVTTFANSGQKPQGWIQLGHSDFFAYSLQQAPTAAQILAAQAPLTP